MESLQEELWQTYSRHLQKLDLKSSWSMPGYSENVKGKKTDVIDCLWDTKIAQLDYSGEFY